MFHYYILRIVSTTNATYCREPRSSFFPFFLFAPKCVCVYTYTPAAPNQINFQLEIIKYLFMFVFVVLTPFMWNVCGRLQYLYRIICAAQNIVQSKSISLGFGSRIDADITHGIPTSYEHTVIDRLNLTCFLVVVVVVASVEEWVGGVRW